MFLDSCTISCDLISFGRTFYGMNKVLKFFSSFCLISSWLIGFLVPFLVFPQFLFHFFVLFCIFNCVCLCVCLYSFRLRMHKLWANWMNNKYFCFIRIAMILWSVNIFNMERSSSSHNDVLCFFLFSLHFFFLLLIHFHCIHYIITIIWFDRPHTWDKNSRIIIIVREYSE